MSLLTKAPPHENAKQIVEGRVASVVRWLRYPEDHEREKGGLLQYIV
jgi:hypothetical protein